MPQSEADFSFRIEFEKGQGNPRRIFDSASELIDGFEMLDQAISGSVDTQIQPVLVLEDVKEGSLRIFLSSVLKRIDDEGLKQGEIKKAIGPALVEAKYAAIAYLDRERNDAANEANKLRETLRNIAASSDLRRLGDYAPIHEVKLASALDSIQDAKRLLGPKDKLLLEAPLKKPYEVDLTKTWDPSEAIAIDKATSEKYSEGEIILTVRKPDMIGNSKWQFARGKHPIFAKITHESWLKQFHDRKIGFRSGDAMRCRVKFTYIFDEKGTMLEEQIEIIEVLDITDGSGGEQLPIGL